MTDKKTEALKLALESAAGLALEVMKKHRQMKGEYPMGMLGARAVEKIEAVFREMDDALAEQPAQDQGQSCYCPECARLSKELDAIKGQQQCMEHGECFGGECIYPAQQPAQQCWKCGDMDAEFQAKCTVPACGMKEKS